MPAKPGEAFDLNGYPIEVGDLIRTHHFRCHRRRIHYLYHVVRLHDGHLEGVPVEELAKPPGGGRYWLKSGLNCTQIINGYNADSALTWYQRPRNKTVAAEYRRLVEDAKEDHAALVASGQVSRNEG